MDKMKIQDDSGDRKYFTIVPNYILNHSTLYDREVYLQMKRITGENGSCWTSRATLAKQCGISMRRLDKSLQYLLSHKWINKVGVKQVKTAGGIQEINEYQVSDLWKLNSEYYQSKGSAPDAPPAPDAHPSRSQGGAPRAHKEELYNQDTSMTSSDEPSSPLIPQLIDAFQTVNPSYKKWFGHKTQRAACERLLATHGLEGCLKVVDILPRTNRMLYVPTITSPVQLEDKWAQLEAALKKQQLSTVTKGRGIA